MFAKVHEWGARPIVTLISEFATWDTQWHNHDAQTFSGGINNALKIQLECKYKKPYGGSACYRVNIDKQSGSDWVNIIMDEFGYYPDPPDNQWHSEFREYQLRQPGSYITDKILCFRITTQIEGPGHLPTGSGPGSYGFWGDAESHVFTATFTKVSLDVAEAHIKYIEKYIKDLSHRYRAMKPKQR